jgi:hypothetical protein
VGSQGGQAVFTVGGTIIGGAGQTILASFSDTGFTQNGSANLTAFVKATITKLGALTLSASSGSGDSTKFVQWEPNGATELTFSTFPPKPDATFSGTGSNMVTDDGSYPMNVNTTITGGDITFNFVLKNTLTN